MNVPEDLTVLAVATGIDLAAGLKTANGNVGLYVRLLKMFVPHHADDVVQIHAALADGERETAQRCAHSLKGAAAALGAENLRQRALAVEMAIRESRPMAEIMAVLATLEGDQARFVVALAALADAPPAAVRPAASVPVVEATARLAALENLLAADDLRAHALWRNEAAIFAPALGAAATGVATAIEAYDFATALKRLRAARS